MCQNYVAYYRVSTAKQGESGLGLAAQQSAVREFVAGKGGEARLLASYTEVESGKKGGKRGGDRPEVAKALEHAKLTGAVLLIAKLDRLSRDAHFLLGLQNAGVDFTAVDMPHADRFVVGVMAMVAEKEGAAISLRTKEALAQVKPRVAREGQRKHPHVRRLGNPYGAQHLRKLGNSRGVAAIKAKAQERASDLAATITKLRAQGTTSANGMARELNSQGYVTPRNGKWTARSVLNVIARLDA
jgi:DNA invertase Pin-like site-specific DNA recombinase